MNIKVVFGRHPESVDNPLKQSATLWRPNARDIKRLDKMQNVGYTCHLHPAVAGERAIFDATLSSQ